jgi:hypothetical protein
LTIADLRKKKEKIETKVAQLLAEQMQTDRGQDDPIGPGSSGGSRQRQADKLPKKAELIDHWVAENQSKQGAAGRERQSKEEQKS